MEIDRPIAIAVTLFVIVLLVFFLVAPEYKTFGKLQTELGEKRAEFNAEFEYYAEITKSHNDLQARKEEIKKIDDALPKTPDLGGLVYFLQETGKQNGMIVKNLFLAKSSANSSSSNKQGATAGMNVKDVIFSMDLLGDYNSLKNLLVALEKSTRLFEVTNISFSGEAATSSPQLDQPQFQLQQTYSFNLQIKTHSY